MSNENEKGWFRVDEGSLLARTDKEFKRYSNVYDKQYGYYDSSQFEALCIAAGKSACDVRNKDNYYLVITQQGDEAEIEHLVGENGIFPATDNTGVDYSAKNIVYYEALMNGEPVIIEGAPVPNALTVA